MMMLRRIFPSEAPRLAALSSKFGLSVLMEFSIIR